MKRYSAYKPSGVEWIGDVPEKWEICRLKNYCSLKGRIGWNGLRSDEFKDISYAYLVTGQDFEGDVIPWEKCYQIDKARYDEDPFIQLKNGDLLITKDGTIGKIAKVSNLDKPACLNSGIFVMKQTKNKYSQDYLFWSLKSNLLRDFNDYTSSGTTILHLYQNVFENMPMLVPPLSEQVAIAAYLDAKCAKIDNVLSVQQKRIDLLKELKQSIITNAVTKGLDKNVEFKPSGIEWIGDIPEKWRLVTTLYTLSMPITDGPHESPELYEEGIPFISAEAVSGGVIDFDNMRGYISEEYYQECCKKYKPEKYDIYMIKSGATTGKTAIVLTDNVFTIWSPLAVYRANTQRINPFFLLYVLRSEYYQKQVESSWSYGTQQNIGMRVLEKLKVALPSLSEQSTILSYLDKKCSAIDSQISKIERQIELLKEYKQSIITECVTGKRKVC